MTNPMSDIKQHLYVVDLVSVKTIGKPRHLCCYLFVKRVLREETLKANFTKIKQYLIYD